MEFAVVSVDTVDTAILRMRWFPVSAMYKFPGERKEVNIAVRTDD